MKSVLFALVAIFCSVVAANEPVSVVNHGAAPAAASAAVPAPTQAPAASGAVVVDSQPARQVVIVEGPRRCPGGRCASSAQSTCTGPNCQYAVKENAVETVRRRLFGGVVIRNNNRTVVKPVR